MENKHTYNMYRSYIVGLAISYFVKVIQYNQTTRTGPFEASQMVKKKTKQVDHQTGHGADRRSDISTDLSATVVEYYCRKMSTFTFNILFFYNPYGSHSNYPKRENKKYYASEVF